MIVKMKVIDAKNLRTMIANKGYSIRSFSSYIGVSGAYMSDIINENRQPSAHIAWKIAQGLNEDIENIFFTVYDSKRETNVLQKSLTH